MPENAPSITDTSPPPPVTGDTTTVLAMESHPDDSTLVLKESLDVVVETPVTIIPETPPTAVDPTISIESEIGKLATLANINLSPPSPNIVERQITTPDGVLTCGPTQKTICVTFIDGFDVVIDDIDESGAVADTTYLALTKDNPKVNLL